MSSDLEVTLSRRRRPSVPLGDKMYSNNVGELFKALGFNAFFGKSGRLQPNPNLTYLLTVEIFKNSKSFAP